MLYHISEEPGIARFEPRLLPTTNRPVVWAVTEARVRNYLLPRDCPRVTFFAGDKTTSSDRERFLGQSEAVVAFESSWLNRVWHAVLFRYYLPEAGFECVDHCAGYFQNGQAVEPITIERIEDCLGELAARGVEIRIVPSLLPLHDAVVASTLSYSIIRMRNASPRDPIAVVAGN